MCGVFCFVFLLLFFLQVIECGPCWNQFLREIPFRMETTVSVHEVIRVGDFATSVDLTDAYFHVLIHPGVQKWLCFVWISRVCQFRALPFGCLKLHWFSHRSHELLSLDACCWGICLWAYLSGCLVQAESQTLCLKHSNKLICLTLELGFTPKWAKSTFWGCRSTGSTGLSTQPKCTLRTFTRCCLDSCPDSRHQHALECHFWDGWSL